MGELVELGGADVLADTEVLASGVITPDTYDFREPLRAVARVMVGYRPVGHNGLAPESLPLLQLLANDAASRAAPDGVSVRATCDGSNNCRIALREHEVSVSLWFVKGDEVSHVTLTRLSD